MEDSKKNKEQALGKKMILNVTSGKVKEEKGKFTFEEIDPKTIQGNTVKDKKREIEDKEQVKGE